jgi:hypothetical protein
MGTGLFWRQKDVGQFLQFRKIIPKGWLRPLLFHGDMCIFLCPAAGGYIFLEKLAGSCRFFID